MYFGFDEECDMQVFQAKLLIDAGCALAECPIYDKRQNGLYWADIEKNRIYFLDLSTDSCCYAQLDRPVGSIVQMENGKLLAGLDDGVYLLDGLRYEAYCRMPEAFPENIRFNDGRSDPKGRFVVGTQVVPNRAKTGHLFSVVGKDAYQILTAGVGCSNGLAWSTDQKTMYYIDTLVEEPSRIYAFDYDVDTGSVANKREILDFSKEAKKGILADGMTIDEQGNLWIAEWGGYGVGCWDPRTGEKIAWISVPTEFVTCCAFGGEDYATLFITTASGTNGGTGGIFTAVPGVRGAAPYRVQAL